MDMVCLRMLATNMESWEERRRRRRQARIWPMTRRRRSKEKE